MKWFQPKSGTAKNIFLSCIAIEFALVIFQQFLIFQKNNSVQMWVLILFTYISTLLSFLKIKNCGKKKSHTLKGRYHLSDFRRYLHYRPLFLGLLHLFFWTWELFLYIKYRTETLGNTWEKNKLCLYTFDLSKNFAKNWFWRN